MLVGVFRRVRHALLLKPRNRVRDCRLQRSMLETQLLLCFIGFDFLVARNDLDGLRRNERSSPRELTQPHDHWRCDPRAPDRNVDLRCLYCGLLIDIIADERKRCVLAFNNVMLVEIDIRIAHKKDRCRWGRNLSGQGPR